MNKMIILNFFIWCNTLVFAQKSFEFRDSINEKTILGDVNEDGVTDTLKINISERVFSINIVNENNKKINKQFNVSDLGGSVTDVYIDSGFINIFIDYSGNGFTSSYEYYYKWLPSRDDWYLIGTKILWELNHETGVDIIGIYPSLCDIDNTSALMSKESISLKDTIISGRAEKSFIDDYNKVINYPDSNFLTNVFTENKLLEFLFFIGVKKINVQKFNDLAYYLVKKEDYNNAVFILANVTSKFPQRTVAYINLGDAYWGLEEKNNAKQAYQKYIELMKASGKEYKIPKRVFERIKE